MQTLTPKQESVYKYIVEHRVKYQTLPTATEIQYGMGFKHYNSVRSMIETLISKEWLKRSYTSVGYMISNL